MEFGNKIQLPDYETYRAKVPKGVGISDSGMRSIAGSVCWGHVHPQFKDLVVVVVVRTPVGDWTFPRFLVKEIT